MALTSHYNGGKATFLNIFENTNPHVKFGVLMTLDLIVSEGGLFCFYTRVVKTALVK